ncbi:MAG: SUMF1/EgtB/PvdO family nonheme iron enzyme, partial [Phycisphaerae bacterium]|nr:SUMF1/EgtB/PvdO family nonheme iron enzyme [Phycisphaerae bacterium]
NATEFCVWLSKSTGRRFRLPTEAEWEHAARAGAKTDAERLLGKGIEADKLAEYAVFADNASGQPAPAGSKKPNALGLKDMLGNVQEWVVGADGKPVTKGGSYRSKRSELSIAARAGQEPSWNASDPQIPKSRWWLSDGPFVGFRVVCEMQDNAPAQTVKPAAPKP